MINGTFLLFPTKGKSEEEIQTRVAELSALTEDKNLFYAIYGKAEAEDDYNSIMVVYAVNCRNTIIAKDYKEDAMCKIAFDIILAREDGHGFQFEK
jgi:hypothetical protein